MAKFLAELLGCTLPDKGTSSMFESRSQSRIGLKQSTKQKTTTFSTLANEKSVSDRKWESYEGGVCFALVLKLTVILVS
ncbi:ras-GEF domain-containing family member 1B-A isoform X9 [Mauremys reevesii]|uniref:ras-GEF domain-containing family member 1B-A isoform X9 n=1 Tax=Mauremys reevesii TaxID=260615 RepID=UPI00193F062C|nr:ras-GEF domain-containing family member 1B-A isoform X9 [Mauremys reevesii]